MKNIFFVIFIFVGQFKDKKIIGAGLFAIDTITGDILLCRRGMKGDSPNTFCPFGGTFEAIDATPMITAQREFSEESGCKVGYKISKKPFYINDSNFLTFYTYIGLFNEKFSVQINSESLSYGWYGIDNLPNNLLPGFEELINEKYFELKYFIEKIKIKY